MSEAGMLLDAVAFACAKHRDQRREDSTATPYINHVVGVADILAQDGGVTNIDVLRAAILHDTLEDTDTTREELEEHFGPEVTRIVVECTDDTTLPKPERKRLQVEHTQTMSVEG